ncbi:MAG: CoB--CoM heterodisulfide reductase iron-sulfur subunit B family protein [Deltaproteobacteria bacterium]|nr:CoB--CoM heterodisulfide reductase iron-sulfur subunit B family protein [Deltaproteobacteria bacterium]
MMSKLSFAYYPGCSLESSAKEYDVSTRKVADILKVELIEIPDWSCCGASPAHTVDHLFASAVAARNLAIVEEMGRDTLVTPCPECLSAFKKAIYNMSKDDGFKKKVNSLLDKPFNLNVEAKSFLQILYEDVGKENISKKVIKPLIGVNIVPYYGCLLTRPPDVAQFDDPENPISMDTILETIGANVPYFSYKLECCGAAYGVTKRRIVTKLSGDILKTAIESGADAVAVACPLCQQNLDLRQDQINRDQGFDFHIPILYITQLMGLSFGLSASELMIDKHNVKSDHFLEKIEKGLKEKEKSEKESISSKN